MGSKRGNRATPPPRPGGYTLRFATTEAAKGWDELARQVPNNLLVAYDAIEADPTPAPTERRHQLKYEFATGIYHGRVLDQWQYEITGGGRIWYLVDPENRTCWIRHAGTGHPKKTD